MERLSFDSSRDDSLHRGARRSSARQPIHGAIRVVAPHEAHGVLFNVSAGGLRFALDRPLAPGDVIDVEVHLVDDTWTQDRAEVVWCRELPDGWLVGVRFVASPE